MNDSISLFIALIILLLIAIIPSKGSGCVVHKNIPPNHKRPLPPPAPPPIRRRKYRDQER